MFTVHWDSESKIPETKNVPPDPFALGLLVARNGSVYVNATQAEREEALAATGRELWAELHTSITLETLAKWEAKIPSFECRCRQFYDAWKVSNPPREADFFAWTIDLHNAVNRKLDGKLEMCHSVSRFLWHRETPRRCEVNVPVVSSLSPKRLERQLACVQSWLASGFHVVLMQTRDEIEQYGKLIDVEWIPVKTPRPLIRDMVRIGMVVNSDCEMVGHVPQLAKNQVHLRWNYEPGRPAREEHWGIDACWIDPDILPRDFPFMLGDPFWDYAVPAFMRQNSVPFSICHKPWLKHLKHELNWSQEDWHRGHDWVCSRLGGDYSSAEYRNSLDPAYSYHPAGLWITDEERKANKVTRDV